MSGASTGEGSTGGWAWLLCLAIGRMSLAGACSESVHEGLLGDGSRCILTGGLNVVLLVAPPGYILSVGECSGKELAIVCVEGQPESLPLPHPSLVPLLRSVKRIGETGHAGETVRLVLVLLHARGDECREFELGTVPLKGRSVGRCAALACILGGPR